MEEFNLKEIVEAFLTKINPTEEQKALAESRAKICQECPDLNGKRCGRCGCFIGTKIYSKRENPCPLKKWRDVDRKYFNTAAGKALKIPTKLV